MEIVYSSIKDIEGLYNVLADEARLKVLFMLTEMGRPAYEIYSRFSKSRNRQSADIWGI